jgi:two-component system phosphate regulon response regulator PhoB
LSTGGEPVRLGSTEFRLLLTLLENAGAVATKNDLVSRVWDRKTVDDNVLYIHMDTLRR